MLDRRSFLSGLAGGTLVGAAGAIGGRMLVQSIPYPKTPFANGLTQFVFDQGATQPQISTAIYPAAFYDSGMTWLAVQSWNGTNRIPQVAGYNHSTGYFTERMAVGIGPLVDDDHGLPAICLDASGYMHVFYGCHSSAPQYSSTTRAIAGASPSGLWQINPPISGMFTYPHPVLVGSTIHLFLRKTIDATQQLPLVLFKSTSITNGVASWGSETTLVDFGTDARFYMGTIEKVGTDIHIIATRADYLDTFRDDVYYFVYDTTTGAVKNHDGSFSVASGSLPVTLTQSDTNFRLFEHGASAHEGGAPSLCFDTNGDPHVLFKDGTGSPTGSYDVKHIKRSSGTWSSPVTIATVDNRFNCPIIVPLAGGWVEAWYSLDPGGTDRFGNIVRRQRSPTGTWGPEQTILEQDTVGLGNPAMVRNGNARARVIFSENIDSALDSGAGGLRTYLYGDGGLIPYLGAPAAVNAGTADGNELREDGSNELREDNSIELRETA